MSAKLQGPKTSYSILKRPLITEKSTIARDELNQVAFEVRRDANKVEIKGAVEEVFEVSVLRVNTSIVHGKVKRRAGRVGRLPNWKKAVVTLSEGDTIDLFEGV
jgi:large subunit ribosomal protein L23